MRQGRVSVVLARDYFMELPRGRVMPVFSSLADATLDILPHEVMDIHPDARFGDVEISPDIPLPEIIKELIPGQAETMALMAWLRAGAPA